MITLRERNLELVEEYNEGKLEDTFNRIMTINCGNTWRKELYQITMIIIME